MGINECVMCANFGDPRSRDCELRHKKKHRRCDFWLENLLVCLQLKTTRRAHLTLGTMWVIINGFCKPSLGAPGHVTKLVTGRKWAESS